MWIYIYIYVVLIFSLRCHVLSMVQAPLFVATKMLRGFNTSSVFIPSSEMYSKASIRFIGYEPLCTPYWLHSVQWFMVQRVPDALMDRYMLQFFLKMRERRLKKSKLSNVKQ